MPYFHATLRQHLPSILRHGLGDRGHGQNWPGCTAGTYLSRRPAICVAVMIEQYLAFGTPDSVPREHLEDLCVIVIDDSRVRKELLSQDPQTDHPDSLIYAGVIDVSGLPVLGAEQALAF